MSILDRPDERFVRACRDPQDRKRAIRRAENVRIIAIFVFVLLCAQYALQAFTGLGLELTTGWVLVFFVASSLYAHASTELRLIRLVEALEGGREVAL